VLGTPVCAWGGSNASQSQPKTNAKRLPSRQRRKGIIPPTAKQSCSGEKCGGWPSSGSGYPGFAPKRASSSLSACSSQLPIEETGQPVRVSTHRPQAQHRARITEYLIQGRESTKSRTIAAFCGRSCSGAYTQHTTSRLRKTSKLCAQVHPKTKK